MTMNDSSLKNLKDIPLPSLTYFGVKNDGEHEHFCQKHSGKYLCPNPANCRCKFEVDACGKCYNDQMKYTAFPNVAEKEEDNGTTTYIGPDGVPLPFISHNLPDPETLPPFMRKSVSELLEAEKEREQLQQQQQANAKLDSKTN